MSWPQWSSGSQPSVPPVLNPATPVINSAPAVVPPGLQYTPDQWAQLQQQNWNQWAQWQQQYQQWHQQYGAEYQKSMNALAQAAQQPVPGLPNVAVPPPLPAEVKPPLPTEDPPPPVPSYSTAPPPAQPLSYNTAPPSKINERQPVSYPKNNPNWQQQNSRYPNEMNQNKRSYEQQGEQDLKRQMLNKPGWQTQPPVQSQPSLPVQQSVRPIKENVEELTEAEKKFDKQFAEWEAQFNKWKEQNAEHPDKEQYREYEKKWESWRAQLLERREQMRRKRLGIGVDSPSRGSGYNQSSQLSYNSPQQNFTQSHGYTQLPPKVGQIPPGNMGQKQTSKSVGLVADVKSDVPYNKPPPNLNDEPLKFKPTKSAASAPETEESLGDFIKPNTSGGIPGLDLVKDDPKPLKDPDDIVVIDGDNEKKGPDFDAISKGINTILGDQKLLNMLSIVSQNQNAKISDNLTNTVSKIKDTSNPESSIPNPYREQSNQSFDDHSNHSDTYGQKEFVNNFDDQTRSSFTMAHSEHDMRYDTSSNYGRGQKFDQNRFSNKFSNRFSGPEGDRFAENNFAKSDFNDRPFPSGRDNFDRFPSKGDNADKRFLQGPGRVDLNTDRFGQNTDRPFGGPKIGPGDERLNQERFGPNQDRFGPNPERFSAGDERPSQDRFGPNQERFGPNQERFGTNQERFGANQERFGSNQERFGPNQERFGSGQDRFTPNQNRFGRNQDRYETNSDWYGSGQDRFKSGQNRFGLSQDRFGPDKEGFDPDQESFCPDQERFGPGQDRYGPAQERFPPGQDRYGPNDRFSPKKGRFAPNQERFGSNSERSGTNQERFGPNHEKFGPNQEKFGPIPDRFSSNQDRFGSNQDRFASERSFGLPKSNFRQNSDEGFGGPRGGLNDRPTGVRGDSGARQFGCGANNYNREQFDRDDFDQEPPREDNLNENFDYPQSDGFQEAIDPTLPAEDANLEAPWKEGENYEETNAVQPNTSDSSAAAPPPKSDILQPATVIDYDHKSLKSAEPEVLIEPIYMFDYRHKPISRIPLPQRPKWLTEAVKNIREFDPPVVRPYEPSNLRRYPPPADNWRKERYPEDHWPSHDRRNYNEHRPSFEERRPYGNSRPYDEPKTFNKDWSPPVDNRHKQEKNLEESKQLSFQNSDFGEEKISDTEWPDDDEENDQFEDPKTSIEFSKFQKVDSGNKSNSKNAVLIEDLISPPGRYSRPPRVVIILRGPPGSGKTFLAKLIKDKEVENGGSTPRILSLDDYFMVEQEKEITEEGKKIKIKEMVYEYEAEMEESYRSSLIKSFKKTITDGYFSFIIVDNVNDKVKYFGEMWSFAKQNGFQVYICQLDLDVQTCSRRNIHGRSEADIEKCVAGWEPTPAHHPVVDATSLLQSASIPEVEMEEVNSPESDINELDRSEDQVARSKWDNFDCSVDNLAKLDGVSKPLRHSRTMEEYLQMDTEWTPLKPTKPGQKRVRWADLEEQKQQEKMRAIGFVVGQTNWERMMDPSGGSSALTQTKYIERTGRYKFDQK